MKYILLYLILFFSLSVNGFSNDYLLEEHNISAERFTKSPYATDFQVLSQVLESSKIAGITLDAAFEKNATEYVISYEHNNTEFLSKKITIATLYGNNSITLVQTLLGSQNLDGGFGELPGFVSTVVDTAFALKALSNTVANNDSIANAVTFLISQQNSDGGWSDGVNTSSTYLSAITMYALWLVRAQYDVASSLEAAKTYIESQRKSNGLWDEHFQSAVALIAIVPMYSNNSSLLASVDALNQAQLANQSWDNDPYTTALVLQAIAMASKSVPNPDLGSISGVVVDSDSGIALSNATVTLNSVDENKTLYSDNNGLFVFDSLLIGGYDLKIEKENYSGVQSQITFDGNDVDLGIIRLNQSTGATTASIRGSVNDVQTQLPIENAKVTINGSSVYTNSLGEYQIADIEPGSVSISVEATGYLLSQKTLDIAAGFTLQYSISLTSIESINAEINAVVKGVVVDTATNEYLENVKITVSDGTTEEILFTTVTGKFFTANLHVGNYNIAFEKTGYQSVHGTFAISTTQTIDFGVIELSVDDPNTVKTTTVKGVITDAITKEPIANALISVSGVTAFSAADGSYVVQGVSEGLVELSVSKDGYKSVLAQTTLTQGSTLIFSPVMTESTQNSLKMYGTILDANTSVPLHDVNITITGSVEAIAFTDTSGNYLIEPLIAGDIQIVISKQGYQTITLNTTVEESNIEFSPALHSSNAVIDGKSTISGYVIDVSTNEPVQGVTLYVDGINSGIVSDIDGKFILGNIEATELTITLKKDQYKDIDLMFAFAEPQYLEIGELMMRPITAEDLRADLVAEMINTSNLLQNSQTLTVAGDINITIANRGTVEAHPYNVVAFYDVNSDGNFTKNLDRVLSQYRVETSLAVDALDNLVLELNSTADFRDQPIYIYVDTKNENIELDETNNLYSTAKSCGGKQGNVDLAVCFDYSGSVGGLANMQKNGLISALRNPEKFPRDGSIRLTIMTATNRTYLQPTIIEQSNAESVADTLENQRFYGNSSVDDCLRYAADKLASLEEQSSYKAVTLSGDGYWGRGVVSDRDYAVTKGIDVIDAIGIGRLNWSTLNSIVYPQPAGGDFGVINVATTSEEVSESLVRTFKKQTEISDLTLGKLEVIDHGTDANISVKFKVGNAGVATIANTVIISVYEGNPENGGILLKLATLDQNLSAGSFFEVAIDDITLQEGGELYVVGDSDNQLVECTKENNTIAAILQATTTLGDIAAATDKLSYSANEDVNLSVSVTNPGRLNYALSTQLQITDANGAVVENFAVVDLGLLGSGEVKNISQLWNTTTLLSGAYLLKATLLDSNGGIVNQSSTSFTIISNSSTTDLASLRLEPNKTIYHTTDTVFVESLVGNLSLNSVLRNATLELKAQHTQSGEILFEHNISITPMAPDTLRNIPQTIDLLNGSQGRYALYAKVVAQDGSVLATHAVNFEVQSNLSVSFLGDVSVAFTAIEPGQEQRCIYSLENFSGIKISNQPIRQTLVSLESGKSIMQDELSLTLDVNESKAYEQFIDTSMLANGKYTCILQAQKNEKWRNTRSGEWKGLASATFTVGGTPAPVVVTVPLSNTSKVLLWLLMLGVGVFYLRNYYRNTGAKK